MDKVSLLWIRAGEGAIARTCQRIRRRVIPYARIKLCAMPESSSAKTAAQLDDLAHRGWPAPRDARDRRLGRPLGRGRHQAGQFRASARRGRRPRRRDRPGRSGLPRPRSASCLPVEPGVSRPPAWRAAWTLVDTSRTPTRSSRSPTSAAWSHPSAAVAVAAEAVRRAVVSIAGAPSDDWMALWWSVDGRGDDAEREIARQILTGAPALYASLQDASGVARGRPARLRRRLGRTLRRRDAAGCAAAGPPAG